MPWWNWNIGDFSGGRIFIPFEKQTISSQTRRAYYWFMELDTQIYPQKSLESPK